MTLNIPARPWTAEQRTAVRADIDAAFANADIQTHADVVAMLQALWNYVTEIDDET